MTGIVPFVLTLHAPQAVALSVVERARPGMLGWPANADVTGPDLVLK